MNWQILIVIGTALIVSAVLITLPSADRIEEDEHEGGV